MDFFVSYTQADRAWAEWIAWTLEAAGFTVTIQAWDFAPGTDFVHEMQKAASTARQTIGVLSEAYLASQYGEAEWRVAFAEDPSGEQRGLVPVRVAPVAVPGLLKTRVFIDLVGLDRDAAKRTLLAGVREQRGKPADEPEFPGGPPPTQPTGSEPRFPGVGPQVTKLPPRNPNFTGRVELLDALHASLSAQSAAAVVQSEAIHGLGGIGKTQLALEYAYRFGSEYDIVWWIPADLSTTAASALSDLADRLGVGGDETPSERTERLFAELRSRTRWLLVYDNAESPDALSGLLPPSGSGAILVTSRWGAWGQISNPFPLDVLPRDEAVAFLLRRTQAASETALDELAALLGDLPLALEEAAAYLEDTAIDVDDYIGLLKERAQDLFDLGEQVADSERDRRRIATVWSVSLDRLREEAPSAEYILDLCAFLAPDDIPRDLFSRHGQAMPEPIAELVTDPIAYNELLAAIKRYSMATVTSDRLAVHRLVQAVIRARLEPDRQRFTTLNVIWILASAMPGEALSPDAWPEWARLLPHITAADEHARRLDIAFTGLAHLIGRTSMYLLGSGHPSEALAFASRAFEVANQADEPEAADAADLWKDHLARALRTLGRHADAVRLHEEVFEYRRTHAEVEDRARITAAAELAHSLWEAGNLPRAAEIERYVLEDQRRLVGNRHPDTLVAVGNLAATLSRQGNLKEGLALQREARDGYAELYGPEHPETLNAESNLAHMMHVDGDTDEAIPIARRVTDASRRVLGKSHPQTVSAMGNLAMMLTAGGRALEEANALQREVLEVREQVLGDEHPNTAIAINNLAATSAMLGNRGEARALFERLIRIRTKTPGADHVDTLRTKMSLAWLVAEEDPATARQLLEVVVPGFERALGSDHADTIEAAELLKTLSEGS